MDNSDIVNKYLKKNTENVLLDIILDVQIQSKTSELLKYIFKNNIVNDKKLINIALKYSVINGLYIIVKTLLKYGKADPNTKGFFGNVIDDACDHYDRLTAKILYKYGGRGENWCYDEESCTEYLDYFLVENPSYVKKINDIIDRKHLFVPIIRKDEKKNIDNSLPENVLNNIVIY